MPQVQWRVLRTEVLGELVDVFRRGLAEDPPVRVAPVRLRREPHEQPSKTTPHPYPLEKRQWMSQQMGELERAGLVYSNPQVVFVRVAMAMPKGELFCLVADIVG